MEGLVLLLWLALLVAVVIALRIAISARRSLRAIDTRLIAMEVAASSKSSQ